jgi:hypothetical protein
VWGDQGRLPTVFVAAGNLGSLRLNQLIRRFDPNHDDLPAPVPKDVSVPFEPDPRQMPLIVV